MERITIHAEKREETGKGAARSLRRKDMIPAVLYRGGGSLPIKLAKKEITQFINTTAGEQIMISLQFADGESKLALVKDYQVDPDLCTSCGACLWLCPTDSISFGDWNDGRWGNSKVVRN